MINQYAYDSLAIPIGYAAFSFILFFILSTIFTFLPSELVILSWSIGVFYFSYKYYFLLKSHSSRNLKEENHEKLR